MINYVSLLQKRAFIFKMDLRMSLYFQNVVLFRKVSWVFFISPKNTIVTKDLYSHFKELYWWGCVKNNTALRSKDLGDTRFLIESQDTWDTRILAKSLEDTRFLIFWKKKKNVPIHFMECQVFWFLWLDNFVSQVY